MGERISLAERRRRRQQGQMPLPDSIEATSREADAERFQAIARHAPSDRLLIWLTAIISVLGLFAVYSASAREAIDTANNSFAIMGKQLLFLALGGFAMWRVSRVPFYRLQQWAKPIALVVIGLLVLTQVMGVTANGAERWISLGPISFQPSEFGKISIPLLLAQMFANTKERSFFSIPLIMNFALIGATIILIIKQPSLSMTIILSLVTFGILFIVNFPRWLLLLIGVGGMSFTALKIMHTEYQLRRIQGWLDPWADPQDKGYHLIQSLFAIASGGFLGQGMGMSHQKLYYLPFPYTDFIFSVWAEEWGLLGCVLLIGLFVALLYRGVVIGQQARHPFAQVLAMSITLLLGLQVIINIAVATGAFPVTGVTLPLISYGGTSVVVTMVLLGMLLNISRYPASVTPLMPLKEGR